MSTSKTPAAYAEYLSLNTVKDKLAFNADGRPGVALVRDDKARLRGKKTALSIKYRAQLGLSGHYLRGYRPDGTGDRLNYAARTQADYYQRKHYYRYRNYLNAQHADALAMADSMEGYPRKLFNLSADSSCPKYLGDGWYYQEKQDDCTDWHKYSKSWHRWNGPARWTENRRIVLRKWKNSRCVNFHEVVVPFKSWSGDYLARAVVEAGLTPKKPKHPLAIRLNKAYDAKFLHERRGYKYYSRTLLGEHIDYVIVSPLGMTYHDKNRANLVKGLFAKIRTQSRQLRGDLIDWTACKNLGFCDPGIEAFCDAYGFDTRSSYTPAEIERAVRSNPAAASPFLAELKILAESVNYRVDWSIAA